jgi:hypothetical protein
MIKKAGDEIATPTNAQPSQNNFTFISGVNHEMAYIHPQKTIATIVHESGAAPATGRRRHATVATAPDINPETNKSNE